MEHKIITGRRQKHETYTKINKPFFPPNPSLRQVYQIDSKGEIIKTWDNMNQIATDFNLSYSQIQRAIKNQELVGGECLLIKMLEYKSDTDYSILIRYLKSKESSPKLAVPLSKLISIQEPKEELVEEPILKPNKVTIYNIEKGFEFYKVKKEKIYQYEYFCLFPNKNPDIESTDIPHIIINRTTENTEKITASKLQELLDEKLFTHDQALNLIKKILRSKLRTHRKIFQKD